MKSSRLKFVMPFASAALCIVIFVWSRREPVFAVPAKAQMSAFFPNGSQRVFEKSAQWQLFSLDPKEHEQSKDRFHGFDIMGKTTIRNKATRSKLQKALYGAIADSEGGAASCFQPHHGLRAVYQNQTIDLVICFSCGTTYVYSGDKRFNSYVAPNSRNAQKVWDRVLEMSGAL